MQPAEGDSFRFRSALETGDLAGLRAVPKTDLHIHSVFGTRIERLESWIGAPLSRPPRRMGNLDVMRDYARTVLYPHYTRATFEFLTGSAVEDAIEDGVVRLEMSVDVKFIGFYEGLSEFLDFVCRLVRTYAAAMDFRPEIGVSRDRPATTEVPLASACLESGVFRSLDLYGNEAAQPPEVYRPLYTGAKGIKKKVHVGEFGDADAVEHTLEVLQPDELQHGVAAATSPALMRRLRDARIRLNVCPTSNVCLRVVQDMAAHPIRVLVDNGVRVSVNTDDPMMFGQSVSDEYLALYGGGVLSAQELDGIRRDSLVL